MWQETKHGLYKQFSFDSFREAWSFMQRVSEFIERTDYYPRWQNERNVVDIWLLTNDEGVRITEHEHEVAVRIDALALPLPEGRVASSVDEKSTIITEVQLYADGGSRGNPGPSSSGYVILNMNDEVILRRGEYLGVTTNNQAEYQALKLGLERSLHDFSAREVHVYMDSMLVINQMKNIFKIKNRDLWPIHNACVELTKKFQKVTFDHVPRELNKLADAEVNKVLDEELKGEPDSHKRK